MKSKETKIKQCYDVLDDELKIINYFYNNLLEESTKNGFKEVELTSFEVKDKFENAASVVPTKIFNKDTGTFKNWTIYPTPNINDKKHVFTFPENTVFVSKPLILPKTLTPEITPSIIKFKRTNGLLINNGNDKPKNIILSQNASKSAQNNG